MNHFSEFLPILTALVTVSSAAIFGFLLPKWADYFNDRSRTKLKDILDIRKNLKTADKAIDEDKFDKIIDFYVHDFIRKELQGINSNEKEQDKKLGKHLTSLFGLIFVIPVICLAAYVILLNVIQRLGY